jgi:tetratricopeptide (TPR) repeat protein
MFAQAMRHHELGELLAAEASCRAVLGRDSTHVGCLHLLGTLAQQTGRFEEAASCFRTLAKSRPEIALAHHGLGMALAALGRAEEAAAAFERALSTKLTEPKMPMPDEAKTALNLGFLYEQLRKPDRSIAMYERAIAVQPGFAEAYNNLGILLVGQGRLKEASAVFARALKHAPELFSNFADIQAMLFKICPSLEQAIQRVAAAWPKRLAAAELLGPSAVGAVVGDPLFRFVLESEVVADLAMERFLTAVRAAILDRAAGGAGEADDDLLAFACSLARQCFINEYVFAETPEEIARVEELSETAAAAIERGQPVSPLLIASLASYRPLVHWAREQALLEKNWPAPLDQVIAQQVREVREERKLRDAIPRLTSLSGAASPRVREQYEENPYPRWVLAPSRHTPMTLSQFFGAHFPLSPFLPLDERDGVDILVAGCGTGHHPIEMARRFARARVLAVDLSLSSLSYALRKTRELDVRNIEYAQADINELAALGRTFDMVDASGVLHHLADPMQGWKILCGLTRPRGIMRIGLYSELARTDVVKAREFIAQRGFEPTAQDIRRCRQELLDTPLRNLAGSHDFFSLSECRDMMFHVQEHRLRLPQIKEFLASQNLKMIGFEVRAAIRQAYRSRFPNDTSDDLDLWNLFETENPSTFAEMYQFYCQKA